MVSAPATGAGREVSGTGFPASRIGTRHMVSNNQAGCQASNVVSDITFRAREPGMRRRVMGRVPGKKRRPVPEGKTNTICWQVENKGHRSLSFAIAVMSPFPVETVIDSLIVESVLIARPFSHHTILESLRSATPTGQSRIFSGSGKPGKPISTV